MNISKSWKKYLPIVGIALFVYIVLKLNISEIAKEIAKANVYFIFLAIVLVIVMFFIQTLKWWYIARKQKIEVSYKQAWKINLMSGFYGMITPSRIGSIIRADYLKKYTPNIGKGISNFVLDKVLDICSLFLLAFVFSFIFRDKLASSFFVYSLTILLIILFLTWVFLNKNRARVILGFFYNRLVPNSMKERAKSTFNSFYEDIPKKRNLAVASIFNIINWVITYLITYCVGIAVGINLPFIYFLAILPITTVISMIPISVGGFGTREAAMITLFGLFGIEGTKVFSMSIIGVIITLVIPALIALVYILLNRRGDKNDKEIA